MQKEVERNLKYFVWTGGSWAVFDALTAAFLTVFAVALGASNTLVGLISSITFIAVLVAELPGAKLLDYFPKKELVAWTGLVARSAWLLIALAPFIFYKQPLLWIVGIFAFIRFVELLGDPGWTALAADIVPEKKRGEIFGKRNMYIGIGGLLASIIGGFYLDLFPKESTIGFSSLFIVGMLWSILTFYCVMKIKEPREDKHEHHAFADAFKLPAVMWKYSIICTTYYFAVMIASPFFTVYMLKNLGLSYTWFVIAQGIATTARIASQKKFGYLADKFGDKNLGLLCMLATALVPFIYIFIKPANWYMIVPAQIFSGTVWAGVDMAVFNLLLNYTDKERRAAQAATFNMMLAVPNIIGPIIGGWISDTMKILTLSGIPLIFAIATVLRAATACLLAFLPEVRVKKHYPFGMVIKEVLGMHPSRGYEGRIVSAVKQVKKA